MRVVAHSNVVCLGRSFPILVWHVRWKKESVTLYHYRHMNRYMPTATCDANA